MADQPPRKKCRIADKEPQCGTKPGQSRRGGGAGRGGRKMAIVDFEEGVGVRRVVQVKAKVKQREREIQKYKEGIA